MKRQSIITLLVAAAVMAWAGASFAQSAAGAEPKAEAPKKVYHAGGKHDQRGHEAALRAKESRTMQEPPVHAGGRHDEAVHKAAIRADQKEAGNGG